jgi:lysozyme family protein
MRFADSPEAKFARALAFVFPNEGGYVNHRADRGGPTNHGVSLRFLVAEGNIDANRDGLADFDLDMDGDLDGADIRLLTKEHAATLFRRVFWDRHGLDRLPSPLDRIVFDQAVNAGGEAAVKLLQRAINNSVLARLKPDGNLGPRTLAALDSALRRPGGGMPDVVGHYRELVKSRYRGIVDRKPSQRAFLNGWLARADQYRATA